MFSPRLLKYVLAGTVSTLVLVTAVLGAGRWRTGEEPAVIDELTVIRGQQRCSYCGEELQPLTSEECQAWRGKNLAELEALLTEEYPGATILAFTGERVEVEFPARPCPDCSVYQWPPRGYIRLTEDNYIAVFCEDGTLFKKYAEAPGSALEFLAEEIHFTSPEECEQWLINLTS